MREYGAADGQMENLLKDAVLRNRIGTLEVKITNLSPGTYNLTTFHNPGGTCCCGGCFPVQAFSSSTLLAPQYVKMVNRLTLEDAPQAHWNQLVVGRDGVITIQVNQTGASDWDKCASQVCNGCVQCKSDGTYETLHAYLNGFTLTVEDMWITYNTAKNLTVQVQELLQTVTEQSNAIDIVALQAETNSEALNGNDADLTTQLGLIDRVSNLESNLTAVAAKIGQISSKLDEIQRILAQTARYIFVIGNRICLCLFVCSI